MIPQFLVLADDMTGALEAGAVLSESGIESSVSTLCDFAAAAIAAGTPGLVIDTETRHLNAQEAFRRVRNLAAEAAAAGVGHLLKKTDSTLRGNIAAELAALAAALEAVPLIYLPAYPKLGRTVRDGILHVDGRPVSETEFGADRMNPVTESHIPTLLRTAMSARPVVTLVPAEIDRAREAAIYVVDGESERDLCSCAEALANRVESFALAGPAGFAHHFARAISRYREKAPRLRLTSRGGLIVNGSLHSASVNQVRQAVAGGTPLVEPEDVRAAVEHHGWAILALAPPPGQGGLEFAHAVGGSIAGILRHTDLDALVVFGGDTLFGIVTALGSPVLRSLREILPGVPATRISAASLSPSVPGRDHDLLLVSKAGGFGATDVVERIRERLSGR